MIKHIVMWKFKEGEHDNMLIFRDRLLALKGQIPEIRAMEVGINMNPQTAASTRFLSASSTAWRR